MFSRIMDFVYELVIGLKGPAVTIVAEGRAKESIYRLTPTVNGPDVEVGVRSTQVVYRTHYSRPWVLDRTSVVYEVLGYASEEYREQIDPRLLEPVTYPLLTPRFLKWTKYPHEMAINAYLDRVWPHHIPQRLVA